MASIITNHRPAPPSRPRSASSEVDDGSEESSPLTGTGSLRFRRGQSSSAVGNSRNTESPCLVLPVVDGKERGGEGSELLRIHHSPLAKNPLLVDPGSAGGLIGPGGGVLAPRKPQALNALSENMSSQQKKNSSPTAKVRARVSNGQSSANPLQRSSKQRASRSTVLVRSYRSCSVSSSSSISPSLEEPAIARTVRPHSHQLSMCEYCCELIATEQLDEHTLQCHGCPPSLTSQSRQLPSTAPVGAAGKASPTAISVEDVASPFFFSSSSAGSPSPSGSPTFSTSEPVVGGKGKKANRKQKHTLLKSLEINLQSVEVELRPFDEQDRIDDEDGGVIEEPRLFLSCALCCRTAPLDSCSKLAPGKRRIHMMSLCTHAICTDCLAIHLDETLAGQDVVRQNSSLIQFDVSDRLVEPLEGNRKSFVVDSQFLAANTQCPVEGCGVLIGQHDLRQLLPAQTVDRSLAFDFCKYVDLQLQDPQSGFVRCPNCRLVVERIPQAQANLDETTTSNTGEVGQQLIAEGKSMPVSSFEHYEAWRYRCAHCEQTFCGSCFESPYHLGMSCEQHRVKAVELPCRFCDLPAVEPEVKGFFRSFFSRNRASDVCSNTECIKKAEEVCHKKLACSHPCYGTAGEDRCLPCLQEGCPGNTTKQEASDFCAICYVDELKASACLQLGCGHVFHEGCLKEKIQKRWPGARITFNFLNCPTCDHPIDHPALSSLLKEALKFRDLVRSKMLLRLEHEGLNNAEVISDPKSEFHNNPAKYAEDMLCYYPCYKCGKPYFGGFKRCEALVDDNEQFNPQELVCSGCVPSKDLRACRIHGTDFIEYKCKFCCSIAQWYCWGNTHFCTACHRRQENGDYLTRKKKEDLPKCEGKRKCPLGVDHPPTGTEYSLGCALCRKNKHADQF